MASSKVMASWSPTNQDPPRQPSPPRSNLRSDSSRGFGSMNFDDILKNICPESQPFAFETVVGGAGDRDRVREETAEEVWRDIVGGGGGGSEDPGMTLEDFLTKAGAVDEEDVRVSADVTMDPPPSSGFVMAAAAAMSPATGIRAVQFAPDGMKAGGFGVGFGNGMAAVSGGRGKRKVAVEQVPLDKATQQKQKRMIKNRESAARSRERKQAYTVELEALVSQLEEDNARLLKEEAERNKARYQQLMKNLIPVTEKHGPARVLMKKVHSMEW